MGLIKLFCINFLLINNSIFLRLNSLKLESLYPKSFAPFDNLIPFPIAKEILTPEKLPGPTFTRIEKVLSIQAFFCLANLNILLIICSLFFIFV